MVSVPYFTLNEINFKNIYPEISLVEFTIPTPVFFFLLARSLLSFHITAPHFIPISCLTLLLLNFFFYMFFARSLKVIFSCSSIALWWAARSARFFPLIFTDCLNFSSNDDEWNGQRERKNERRDTSQSVEGWRVGTQQSEDGQESAVLAWL